MLFSSSFLVALGSTFLLSASQLEAFGLQSNVLSTQSRTNSLTFLEATASSKEDIVERLGGNCQKLVSGSMLGLGLACSIVSPAMAVSGGGLDYAGTDISGQDFSNNSKTYKGKDFTQVLAKATNFANSNLQGCRFYKAYLINADFTNADIRGTALEDTNMEGANLNGAIASGAYFGQSLIDVASAENADFTDATIPMKTLSLFCARDDVKGTNPVTGEDTRDSLMCP
jgi:uncharacterized protein YjbI with pentapeptide repeats